MKIELFSEKYKARPLTDKDVDEIYELCSKNTLYYDYCPPFITHQGILDDMKDLPPGKTIEAKYYIGFYEKEKLVAMLDLIDGYPQKEFAYIGFFMTDLSMQNKGVGTQIIEYLCKHLTTVGYHSIRLAWVKGNPQSEHFWLKNHFIPIKETTSNVANKVILAERILT